MAQREIATRGMSVQMREKVILKLTFPAKRTESRSIGLARATGKRMHGEMEILLSTLKRQKTQYRHDVVDGVAIANPRHPYIQYQKALHQVVLFYTQQQTKHIDTLDRNPAVVLEKLVKRFKTFMNDNLPKNTKFVSSINAKLERLSARMTAKYQMLNTKCEIWNEPKDDEETNLRFDLKIKP